MGHLLGVSALWLSLDERICATYAGRSTAQNRNSLYDAYIRAFRWASDRLTGDGIGCFVTNGCWVDANTMDGLRHIFEEEFAAIYVLNLRGAINACPGSNCDGKAARCLVRALGLSCGVPHCLATRVPRSLTAA